MKRTVVAAVLALFAVTGCGGDESSPVGDGAPSLPSGLPSVAASALAGAFSQSECFRLAGEYAKAAGAFAGVGAAQSINQDSFQALSGALATMGDRIEDDEAKAAAQTLADAFEEMAKDLEGVTYTPSAGTPPPKEVTDALKRLSEPATKAASSALGDFFQGGCK
jgi:hypothetical protein